jgi:hypothetical protein
MSVEDTFNCNSKRLCGALKSMLSLSSMNDATWIMARDKPAEFIQFVEENLAEIQAEFEGHFKVTAVFPRFIRQNAKVQRDGSSWCNKIGFIKMIRMLANVNGVVGGTWGLADSKSFVESLPRDYRLFYFNSIHEAESSKFYSQCLDMAIEVEWVPLDSTQGLVRYADHKGKDIY